MGHDVGHTPFGHVGEYALRDMVGHFNHNEQSLRMVESIEKDGQGLNLTTAVRDGILGHTGSHIPVTLEGQIIRTADRIAYLCHDFDDALRAHMLRVDDLPKEVVQVFGDTHSKMITAMVTDMVTSSMDQPVISMSDRGVETMNIFRRFMFERVYRAPSLIPDRNKGDYVVKHLFMYYKEHPEAIRHEIHHDNPITDQDIVDYVAGLTDNYAIKLFTEYYIPKVWDN